MNEYIKNVNLFLSQTKIKPSYISLKSGIDEEELSHILSGEQEVKSDDIIKIAKSLGKDVNFFLSDKPQENINYDFQETVYPEETSEKQKQFIDKTLRLLENIDQVLSSKNALKIFQNNLKKCYI